MKIWKLESSEKSLVINLKDYEADKSKVAFKGQRIIDWSLLEFESVYRKKNNYDLISFSPSIPVFSEKAKRHLESHISSQVQFFSIVHEKPLFLVNVIQKMDCLDYERSKYMLRQNGSVGYIEQIYFKENEIGDDVWIFKLLLKGNEKTHSAVYVTEHFRNAILASKLKGFEFVEVWDSEFSIEREKEIQSRYDEKIKEINSLSDLKLSWSIASQLVNEGKAIASDRWKLQKNKNGDIVLGELTMELTYQWMRPVYYPPVLLSLNWCEVERSEV